jgi:hypothetical protein
MDGTIGCVEAVTPLLDGPVANGNHPFPMTPTPLRDIQRPIQLDDPNEKKRNTRSLSLLQRLTTPILGKRRQAFSITASSSPNPLSQPVELLPPEEPQPKYLEPQKKLPRLPPVEGSVVIDKRVVAQDMVTGFKNRPLTDEERRAAEERRAEKRKQAMLEREREKERQREKERALEREKLAKSRSKGKDGKRRDSERTRERVRSVDETLRSARDNGSGRSTPRKSLDSETRTSLNSPTTERKGKSKDPNRESLMSLLADPDEVGRAKQPGEPEGMIHGRMKLNRDMLISIEWVGLVVQVGFTLLLA